MARAHAHDWDTLGLLAQYDDAHRLDQAVRAAAAAGYAHMEAFSPFPMPDVAKILGRKTYRVEPWTLAGGLVGLATAYGMQWFSAVIHYPFYVGGKPLHSIPAFIPVSFELTMLFATLATVFALYRGMRLPRYHHPLFGIPAFKRAGVDAFFLAIAADDPKYREDATRQFLLTTGATHVHDIRD